MMRVKIPSGILSADGLRAIGEISETYGRDQGELTTRQNIQLHYITLDKFPEILEKLKSVGLTTMGGCGDVVRNITGCPVAGVDPDEVFDVTPLIAETAGFFYGNREYSDLPRKHKISIAACKHQCNAPEINCVSLIAMLQRRARRLCRARRRRPIVDAAPVAAPGRVHHARSGDAGDARDYRRLAGHHRVPDVAGQGAPQVHDRRLRRR